MNQSTVLIADDNASIRKVLAEAAYRGIGSGADEYLAKPFNINDLRARVTALLGRNP